MRWSRTASNARSDGNHSRYVAVLCYLAGNEADLLCKCDQKGDNDSLQLSSRAIANYHTPTPMWCVAFDRRIHTDLVMLPMPFQYPVPATTSEVKTLILSTLQHSCDSLYGGVDHIFRISDDQIAVSGIYFRTNRGTSVVQQLPPSVNFKTAAARVCFQSFLVTFLQHLLAAKRQSAPKIAITATSSYQC